jgi:hypothetical protein
MVIKSWAVNAANPVSALPVLLLPMLLLEPPELLVGVLEFGEIALMNESFQIFVVATEAARPLCCLSG